jgi:hypothetical protein
MMEPLLCYHPFWLRLGLLIVTRDANAAADRAVVGGKVGTGGASVEGAMRRGLQVCVCVCDAQGAMRLQCAGGCRCVCVC